MAYSTMVANKVIFTVNGKRHEVGDDIPPDISLNTYLRNYSNLKGTKYMCLEGGCGACVVSIRSKSSVTNEEKIFSVNSCLVPILSCHSWEITTIEGIGNKKVGYHKLQTRLAHLNGTQCGYCSPGMVMNMYSISEGKDITMQEVENSFGGNICRCTGYRPILDAFKSFCSDAPPELMYKVQDIEDLDKIKVCSKTNQKCTGNCDYIHGNNEHCLEEDFVHVNENGKGIVQNSISSPIHISLRNGTNWYKVSQIEDIFKIFKQFDNCTYILIAGNTAQGVYRVKDPPQVYIDVKDVPELIGYSKGSSLKLGGNMSLTDAKNLFNDFSKTNHSFSYLSVLGNHIDLIANIPVRNIGTLAGNLMIKYHHNEFPSDVFLLLETVGATLNITSESKTEEIGITDILDLDMNEKIIESIVMPPIDEHIYIKTYKIMPRSQNAHAYVNAGFKFNLDRSDKGKVLEKPTIIFGGINSSFIHADSTESYLDGKMLFDTKVLQTTFRILKAEIIPDHVLPNASPEYRTLLACGLFYKFILSLNPPGIPDSYKSGGQDLKRPLSRGQQKFQTDPRIWPLNQPIQKLEGLAQTTGEAQFLNDIPAIPGELFGAFVTSTIAQGYISNIDPSEALRMPGVIAFLTAQDIPGKNNFCSIDGFYFTEEEEIFCSGRVKFAGQVLGMIVAESHNLAIQTVTKVKVEYSNVTKPIVTIRDAIASGDKSRIREVVPFPSDTPSGSNVTHVIKGTFDTALQYHFPMETIQVLCVPTEDGIDIYPSSQHINFIQAPLSEVLNLKQSQINIKVKRIGGGFGGKISRCAQVSAACAIAARYTNKAVRVLLPLETNMESMGKRYDSALDYEVGVDSSGQIQYMKTDLYEGKGASWNEHYVDNGVVSLKSCYDNSAWKVRGLCVRSDIPTNLWMRGPATTEAVAGVEHIMEHIAKTLEKDPIDVRLANISAESNAIKDMINDMKVSAEYEERKLIIEGFNQANRWVKRGITLVPILFPVVLFSNYSAMVCIYAYDGSVAVVHGGIECGQGINTKVAQVVASTLGVNLDIVTVKPTTDLTSPNNNFTGGSITSGTCCWSAVECCKELLKRMEPVKKTLQNPTWLELVQAVNKMGIELVATHMFPYGDDNKGYDALGVTVTEVELDVITGERQILRVDILQDAGRSLSPDIDIGQVEGGFVMGLGLWLQEYIVHDPDTGCCLTNRTWNYKPPGAKDIPIDFRIELRKDAPNPFGFLRSKTTGEPPLCLACSVLFALRRAIESARKDAGLPDNFFPMELPATPEHIVLASELDIKQFTL